MRAKIKKQQGDREESIEKVNWGRSIKLTFNIIFVNDVTMN